MKQNKLLCVILSVALMLSLFAGCGNTDDLTGLDKYSMEYAAHWLRTVMPELSEPEVYYLDDGSLDSWALYARPLCVHIFPADNGESVGEIMISFTNPDWASDEHVKQLKDLSVAVAKHYLAPDVSSHVASVLDIGPIANKDYEYDASGRLYISYDAWGNCTVYYSDAFGVTLDMATGRPTHVSIRPDIPTADPDLQACQERINRELAQAGYPVNVYFYENRSAVVYTGSGEDIYTNYVYIRSDSYTSFETINVAAEPGANEEARKVVRIIGRIIAQYGENSFSAEFMEAFFDLWSVSDSYTEGQFVNQYGAKLTMYSDGINAVEYDSDNRWVWYSTSPDAGDEFSYEFKSFTPETETIEPKYAKHILISEYLPKFAEKVPEAWDAFQLEDNTIVRILDPESGALVFRVLFYFRPDDNVIERISASCDAAYVSDAKIDLLFREVTAAVVELCDIGFTADDVLRMYEEPFVDEDGYKCGGLYGDGIFIDYMYHDTGVYFSMEFALEDLSDDQSDDLSSAENYFAAKNVWNGPAVVDGRFKWISDIALEDLPDELYVWFEEYFSTVDVSLRLSPESGTGQTEDGAYFARSGFSVGIDIDLDETQFGLITVLDDNPHFIMGYNEDLSTIMGLGDGIYYYGASPEVIRQFPICLSLLCDDGMTVSEAKELFSHSVEPTKMIDDAEVTLYCPREVAHILVYDSQTDASEYTVMTKADFETTYGGSLDAFIQNYS